MNDPAAPNEHPPYWSRCEAMTFDQLAEFIEEAREKLSGPVPDANLPRSLEEFRALCEMLREKYEPEEPQREGGPSWSERLAGKHARRTRLVQRYHDLLRKAPRAEQDKKKRRALNQEVRRAEERIEQVDREIDDLTHGDYPTEPVKAIRPRYATYRRICRAVEDTFEPKLDVPTTYITWRLAPPGSTSEPNLRVSVHGPRGQGRLAGFDPDRFENLISLKPNHKYEDPDGIDGYSVFTFDWTPKALMECFNRNNAMFVLGEDMELWPKGNKQKLRDHPSVTWIPHREGWREKLKEALAPSND